MHYYFKQEISTESVNNLVERLEQAKGEINLYFSTNGGDSTAMSFLISFFRVNELSRENFLNENILGYFIVNFPSG